MISTNTSWNIFNFRQGLISALIAAGYEVVAMAPVDQYSERLRALGCRHVALPMDNQGVSPLRDLLLLGRYLMLLGGERPCAFLGFTIKPNVYGSIAAHLLGIPTVNNVSGLGTAFIRLSWVTRIVHRLYRTALMRSHRVFFQNEDDRSLFVGAGLVRAEATDLLPGSGIDLQHFVPCCPRPRTDATVKFLFVARLLRDKGVMEFVEAARLVRKDNPEAEFQILGFLDVKNQTAIDRATVDAWVAEGTIAYLGTTDDVRPLIAAVDCVVLPSYREGTPRTLLEAAAMGKPLIATDVPGCREVVADGENGFLCQARNSADLAEKMRAFLALSAAERAAMGSASRRKVEREFDEKIVVQRYLHALAEIFRDA